MERIHDGHEVYEPYPPAATREEPPERVLSLKELFDWRMRNK
jgi:hypothetical protein